MTLKDHEGNGASNRPTSVALYNPALVEIKSRFYHDIRRYCIEKERIGTLEHFIDTIVRMHKLRNRDILLSYTDPFEKDELPITNDNNLRKAISTTKSMLRVQIFKQEDADLMFSRTSGTHDKRIGNIQISRPKEFRQVSAVVDADKLPQWKRRVKLLKHASDKPLGFFIRDGTNVSITDAGIEKVPSIFISRLLPGGLAESTGLLSVGDEVLEVNNISVEGKSLDQVTDMMIANAQNLIITVKPTSQPPKQNPRLNRPYASVQLRIKGGNPQDGSNSNPDQPYI